MTEKSTLSLENLTQKNIAVLGAGLTGLSCLRFFQQHNIPCAVNDNRPNAVDENTFAKEFPNVTLSQGKWDENLLANADVVIASPGIDINAQGIKVMLSKACLLVGDVELFCQLSDIPSLAVTGSNGKSTVVSLLAYLGKALGYNVALGGNIGVPVLEQLQANLTASADNKLDCLILELSSFQLETLTSMNALASSILNVSDDHLDRHHSIENYQSIKQRIYTQAKVNIFNRDDRLTKPQVVENYDISTISFGSDMPLKDHFGLKEIESELWLMHGDSALIAMKALPIAGIHNALNCLSAFALGMQAGWPLADMVKAVISFKGLAHRCQLVESGNSGTQNVQWINDSKATNVGATQAALEGLLPTLHHNNKLILIAGGDGKGADFSPLTTVLNQKNIELITLGKDGELIANLLSAEGKKSQPVKTMREAVNIANDMVDSGDIVLLSPACASIDMFKNYLERGDKFTSAIQSLATCVDKERR